DVKLIYLKGMVEILTGINQGNADAGIFTSPTTLKAQHAGLKELVNVTEQNIPMIHAALASTREYIKTRPDNVRRFLQAYLEGIKISFTEPDFAKQVIGKYTKTTDAADLEKSYQTFLAAWERVPLVPPAARPDITHFAIHPRTKTAEDGTLLE